MRLKMDEEIKDIGFVWIIFKTLDNKVIVMPVGVN